MMSTVDYAKVGRGGAEGEVPVTQLHPRRLEILRYLGRRRWEEPPSVVEIAGAVRLKSTQTVHHHLVKLESDGYIERLASPSSSPYGKRRPVRLTEMGWEAVGEAPMLGRIAAGPAIEAVSGEEVYSLFGELLAPRSGKRRFLLTAQGQSMAGAGIADGDRLIVEEDESPADGTVVAALLPGEEVTVKRLQREGDTVRLKPENEGYEDIVVPAEQVRVQGRVVMVLHPPRR